MDSTLECSLCKPGRGPQPLNKDGVCHYHERFMQRQVKKPIVVRIYRKRRPGSGKRKKGPSPLTLWYRKRIDERQGFCMECGAGISYKHAHASTAHVLGKKEEQFPSVMTHEWNHLELGFFCNCHKKYDSSWESASTMKVWPEVVRRFKLIEPDIVEEERGSIPAVLLKTLSENG